MRTGTVVVIERYRDSRGAWRVHHGCDTCGRPAHWSIAGIGDTHLCDAPAGTKVTARYVRKVPA